MEKSPERRYPTARALAEELNRFLNHEPILARPASPLRKASSWARKHPWTFTSLATFIILGLMTLAYGLWEQNQLLHWQMAHPGKPKPVAEVLERFKEAKESVSLEVALAMNFFFLLYGIWMKRHWVRGTRPLRCSYGEFYWQVSYGRVGSSFAARGSLPPSSGLTTRLSGLTTRFSEWEPRLRPGWATG